MSGYFIDHNVTPALARLLEGDGQRALTARDLHLQRASDDVILLEAARRDLAILTQNRHDFEILHDAWRHWAVAWEREIGSPPSHAGILGLPQIARQEAQAVASAILALTGTGSQLRNEYYSWDRISWTRRP